MQSLLDIELYLMMVELYPIIRKLKHFFQKILIVHSYLLSGCLVSLSTLLTHLIPLEVYKIMPYVF